MTTHMPAFNPDPSFTHRPPECAWCDGSGKVHVGAIIDCMGVSHTLTERYIAFMAPETTCPRCQGSGEEPPVEREAP